MEVVPIRVKIGLRPNGHADHPAWEKLPMIAAEVASLGGQPTKANPGREQIDRLIGQHWLGSWNYDKTSGHQDDTPDSPRGQQWGILFVSRQFANEAMATFPTLVTEMTRSEAITFYNDRANIRRLEEREDVDILQGLVARRQLMVSVGAPAEKLAALDARIRQALDPDTPELGVRRDPLRRFATARLQLGLTWHPSVLP